MTANQIDEAVRLRGLAHEVATHGPKNWRKGLLAELQTAITAMQQGDGEAGILRTAAEYHYAQAACPRDQFGNTSNHRNPRLEAWHRQVADAITAIIAPPSTSVGVKTLSEFMAEQEALHPGIHDKVQAAADELRASLVQQQGDVEAGAFDTDFMRHIVNLCRAAYDLCQPKPQRTPEDVREHYGELCLLELKDIADEIERRLTASSGKAGEVAGWVRGDTFVDAKFWTADTPPQGWTPVYLTASQTAAVAAIQFALSNPEGMEFLRLWNEGEFDTLRREWPDAPSEVYVGADPLATKQQEPKL